MLLPMELCFTGMLSKEILLK
uniref:Uncharacterized protein n=1 Tax=Arundo donax TaxID=35708 RepID=A0A0A8ZQU2_ARUDO